MDERKKMMKEMEKIMGKSNKIERIENVVEKKIRMRGRKGRMGEGERRIEGEKRRVDKVNVKEFNGDIGNLGREIEIGGKKGIERIVKRDKRMRGLRKRWVEVKVLKFLKEEKIGFKRIIEVRKKRIGILERIWKRIKKLKLKKIGKMMDIGNIIEKEKEVGNLIVIGKSIGDESKGEKIWGKGFRKWLRGLIEKREIGVMKNVKGRIDWKLLKENLKKKEGNGLIEKEVKGDIEGNRFLMEKMLKIVVKMVGIVNEKVSEKWEVMEDGGVLVNWILKKSIIDEVKIKGEENKRSDWVGKIMMWV